MGKMHNAAVRAWRGKGCFVFMSIKITADSTCDLSPELLERFGVTLMPLYVQKGEGTYRDGVDITPDDIFSHVAAGGALCKTAAPNIADFTALFSELSGQYDAVIHITISAEFSSSYQNACVAAEEFDNVYVVDSRNLSTGQGHVVMEACRLAKTMDDLDAIKAALDEFAPRVDASFLLDRLDYMVKGGRCSSVVALGANLLKLKPCIEVIDNKMIVGKKYRGNYTKCMEKYVLERLENATDVRPELIFITHTPVSDEILQTVHSAVRKCKDFEQIVETTAGCTISCHCGEGCLGVLYVHEKPKGSRPAG